MTTPLDETPQSPGPEATSAPAGPARDCSHCGAALADGQDWCLECGAATPGALRSRGPARAGGMLLALTAILVVAAAGAAYAALRTPAKHIVLRAGPVTTSALAPAVGGATGPTGATGAATPPSTGTTLVPAVTPPKTVTPAIPKVTAPVIPATTTPAPAVTTQPPAVVTPPSSSITTSHTTTTTHTVSAPQPLLLDPTATSDYNPNGFPASNFGDPTLAIDGDPTTSWSAQVPTVPPAGGSAGLLVDLRTAQSLASLKLVTDTSGDTFAILGANGAKAPSTIGDPGWTRLAAPHSVKHTQTFKLVTKGHSYRWIVVWILGVKGGPVATLPSTVATAATASTSTASAATTSGASGATATTTTTGQSTVTTTTTSTSNDSPLVTVDVSELSLYP